MRAAIPPEYPPHARTLPERTRNLLSHFDAETKDYGFDDSGEGTTYAEWFADLLDEWLASEPRDATRAPS